MWKCSRLRSTILSDISHSDEVVGKGILAFYQEQWGEARTLLDQALEQDPSREEVWSARAGTAAAQALQCRDPDVRLRFWREAEDFYTRIWHLEQPFLEGLRTRL